MIDSGFLYICGQMTVALLLISMLLALWRIAKGPSAADRVVAMDLLSVLSVAVLVTISIVAHETSYLDVAIAFASIAFLGTIALSRFILRAYQDRSSQDQGVPRDD